MRSLAFLVFLVGCSSSPGEVPPAPTPDDEMRVLVFSKTSEFRHSSIEVGIAALQEMGSERGWVIETSEDAAVFSSQSLARFGAVVWLNTSGDVLNDSQQTAFEEYIAGGGGFVGVHAATDTEYDWPWYGGLVGAYFDNHPSIQEATLVVDRDDLPPTFGVTGTLARTDEWYNFRENPRNDVTVLLSLDESSYEGGTMGDHPIAWQQEYQGGRAFYTALGHTAESYADPFFRAHLVGGIQWAADWTGETALSEFDGSPEPGPWLRMDPRDVDFGYEVTPDALSMTRDSSSNQHIVHQDLRLETRRPYQIECEFEILEPTPDGPTSFAINFQQSLSDGPVESFALNVDLTGAGEVGGTIRYMGFEDGGFRQIGDQAIAWGEVGTAYTYRIFVNQRSGGDYAYGWVSAEIRQGDSVLESLEVDYNAFPYQPTTSWVRFGLNTHGANWVARNLSIRYLD